MCVMLYSTAPNSTAPNSTAPSAAEESATSSAQSEGPVVSLALVPHRNLRRDTRADEPAEELARSVRRVGREPVGLQTQRLFGALDHGLGRSHFVVGAGRSGLHIDDYRVRDVDQVIEPVAELDALVGFRGPSGARVHRRDHLRRLAIGVGIFGIEGPEELGDRPYLAFRRRPVDLVSSLAMITTGVSFNDACIDGT